MPFAQPGQRFVGSSCRVVPRLHRSQCHCSELVTVTHRSGAPHGELFYHFSHGSTCAVDKRIAQAQLFTLVLMRPLISRAASALRCARLRTSLATTAKPRLALQRERFHCGIERQNIGLERDAIDDTNDVHNFAAGILNAAHGLHDLALRLHRRAQLHQMLGLPACHGLTAFFSAGAYIVGHIFHRGCCLLQAGGLVCA